MRWLIQLLVTALTILSIPKLIPGVSVADFGTAVLAAIVLGGLNVVIKPILFFLTFPITLVTLGLFYFVLNGIIFQLMGALVPGVAVAGLGSAFLASLIVSLVSWMFNISFQKDSGGARIVVVRGGDRSMRDLN